jgi:hypothetical protein
MSEKSNNIIVQCPHCQEFIEILEINCAIFRHAIFKLSGQQIDPHSSKDVCEQYIKDDLIFGCGKPFRVIIKEEILVAEVCDYI